MSPFLSTDIAPEPDAEQTIREHGASEQLRNELANFIPLLRADSPATPTMIHEKKA